MRIDEFSNADNIDGSFSATEMTQFLLFGFDMGLNAVASYFEDLAFDSLITVEMSFDSLITVGESFDSPLGE